MNLYLIRHADAVPLGERGITNDEDRPLSEKGERQSEAMGLFLKKKKLDFDRLVTSPLIRAKQTAEHFLRTSGIGLEPELCDGLIPEAHPKKVAKFLVKTGGERVALVGHNPHLAEFVAWLIGDNNAQIEFPKAGIAMISCDDSPTKGNGVLQWLITPEWFE